jgi:hypothetical protein
MANTIDPVTTSELFNEAGLLDENGIKINNAVIEAELRWLDFVFEKRMPEFDVRKDSGDDFGFTISDVPDLSAARGPYADLVNKYQLGMAERLMLIISLVPHFKPEVFYTHILSRITGISIEETRVGGYIERSTRQFIPTLQTVLFLASGSDGINAAYHYLDAVENGKLIREQIISLKSYKTSEYDFIKRHKVVELAQEYVDYLMYGRRPRPDFGRDFPAVWVSTDLTWEHLVLNKLTLSEVEDVMDWAAHGKDVIEKAEGRINKSFPCLFYGPPGTGKSLTAKLIGKHYGKDVFRIDLSMIVSKYIGETEKNLARLFERAENKDWILFFDEADSLFGKRTGISDSKDKWANLEMSYLLQRMEEYEGLCILASNLKGNIDTAMIRRFQAIINFPWPTKEEKITLWKKTIPPGFKYQDDISFEKLSRYDFSGANIANVIKSCCTKAVKRGDYILSVEDLGRFIHIEYAKENRTP